MARQAWMKAVITFTLLGLSFVLALFGVHEAWFAVAALAVLVVVARLSKDGGALDAVPWVKGARGERRVAGLLAPLEHAGYTVLHDVEYGGGNVDHVVIGPTGIFALETKNWAGNIYVKQNEVWHRGAPHPEVRLQARNGALEIKRRLEARGLGQWVKAVVVSAGGSHGNSVRHAQNVAVVDAAALPRYIVEQRTMIDTATADHAAAAVKGARVLAAVTR